MSSISALDATPPEATDVENKSKNQYGVSSSTVRYLLREPLVHFLLLGGALFIAYSLFASTPNQTTSSRIELTAEDLNQLQLTWMAQWKRPPTADELRGLIETKVRQEILYREALSLGLDQGDEIIKRRLAQKIEFLAEDVSTIPEPTHEELKSWFASNSANFALPGRITFRHLYFSPDKRGQNARADAAHLLQRLIAHQGDRSASSEPGDRFMDQDYFTDCSAEQVARVFGTTFSESLFRLNSGSWLGPLESGLGWHLVWIDTITPGRTPAFDDLDLAEVKADWLSRQREETKQKAFASIRERYEVILPN
jgi:hypothetical protein